MYIDILTESGSTTRGKKQPGSAQTNSEDKRDNAWRKRERDRSTEKGESGEGGIEGKRERERERDREKG
jgi:hypothetical protein